MNHKELNCESCLFDFISEIGSIYGLSVCDVVVVFEDGVELHYHDGGNDEEKKINT